ncbi:4'-phosphopantetheinyl transferase family protein [Vibrio splendidus]|uniref:4'-phosphopantetheinyl transferase family protein n=1 Tax=Vibrio splendidus TaxID=29497 RepID=UPI001FB3A6B0|nr:4'-phosphopantetheinyl transferase superfamily protein [Vibrio splendidus]MCQ8866640.1 4'-phosphopantetheinyl transferase superfamily protein [Vibrio splendidus]UOE84132.1 4'-phosphopantetheinyl transferase superfamily protein [Vibrio splendidus]UOE90400.1 4'-phosphopantetheinyl transferase superfamily protein [Vibrio splendidus]
MTFLSGLQLLTFGSQNIKVWQYHFERQRYTDCLFQELDVALPNEMKRAVTKRKAEFIAGRRAALHALRIEGCDCLELPIGEHRSPVWPEGWIGSISHTDDLAVATVSSLSDVSLVGLDVEELINENQVMSLMPMFVSPQEIKHLARTHLPIQWFVTLVFSAKESIFKAIYPHVKTYLEFRDSKLMSIDMDKGEAHFQLCERGEKVFGEALILCVYFFFKQGKAYTLVCEPRQV